MAVQEEMPALFLCHGAPLLAIQETAYTRMIAGLAGEMPQPKGIVLFTAHWESPVTAVSARDDRYETIHDFHGFSEELYRIQYPAPGSLQLAERVCGLLAADHIPTSQDADRGLDHGAWVLLRLLYPGADVPVVAVSVNPALAPSEQYRIGQALAPLAEEGVLVVGSGATCHNLRMLDWQATKPVEWAVEFDDWLLDRVIRWDLDDLFAYEQRAPHARLAVPRNEHLVPLFIAMGCADPRRRATLLHRSYDLGSLSLIAIRFG